MRKPRSSGFPTRSDTNQAVQSQNLAKGFKFRIKKVAAQLICAFVFAYAKNRFTHDATQI